MQQLSALDHLSSSTYDDMLDWFNMGMLKLHFHEHFGVYWKIIGLFWVHVHILFMHIPYFLK